MGIFSRNRNPEALSIQEPSTSPEPGHNPEAEHHFESAYEAGQYITDLLAEKDGILEDFYNQGKSLGMSDEDIASAAKDALADGKLPAIAERAVPLRDGKRPIFLVSSLPPQLAAQLRTSIYDGKIKVSVREDKNTTSSLISSGQLAVLRPGDSQPELLNIPSDWEGLVKNLESEIRRPV